MPPRADALGFVWDEARGQYRRRGRFVSRAQVREALDRVVASAAQRMDTMAVALMERRITLAEWQTQMRLALRDVHAYSAAVAQGGLHQMTNQSWGAVGRELRDQYGYLLDTARGIADGSIPLDGRFRQRVRLAGLSGKVSFEDAAERDQVARGFDEEMNVRGKFDSCEAGADRPGCIDETERGWVKAGTLSKPGTRRCLGNCGCGILRRNSTTGQIAA